MLPAMQLSERTQANIRFARTVSAHGAAGAARVATGITDVSVRVADSMIRKYALYCKAVAALALAA